MKKDDIVVGQETDSVQAATAGEHDMTTTTKLTAALPSPDKPTALPPTAYEGYFRVLAAKLSPNYALYDITSILIPSKYSFSQVQCNAFCW